MSDKLEFKPSSIHGTGGFAVLDIAPGERVVQYVGEKISKSESIRRCRAHNEFIFFYDEEFDLDGSVAWNPARFLNHSCSPNGTAEWLDGEIWIVATRGIRAGEEITFDYGYDLEDFRDHPCSCGAANCQGYILAEVFS